MRLARSVNLWLQDVALPGGLRSPLAAMSALYTFPLLHPTARAISVAPIPSFFKAMFLA